MSRNAVLPLAVLASGLLLASCGSDSSTDSASTETRALDLDFRAINSTVTPSVDITDSVCDTTLTAIGSEGDDAGIGYMAFYLNDVRLITSDGNEVAVTLDENMVSQEAGVALVDFRDTTSACGGDGDPRAIWNHVTGSYEHVEGTEYTGLKYELGLPAELNHAELQSAGVLSREVYMAWNWLAGYRYLRMDLAMDGVIRQSDGAEYNSWTVHVGATGCSNAEEYDGVENRSAAPTNNLCDNPNLSGIELTDFNPDSSRIAVDIAALYAGSNVMLDQGGAIGCMSGTTDPECAEVFARLGLQHATQGEGFATPIEQVVFSTLND